MYSPHKTFASAYQRVGVETGVDSSDPHRLIGMLFDGALGAISTARGALTRGDVATKCQQVSHAARIIDEGLRGSLDLGHGGSLARDLNDLYAYVAKRLTYANLKNDPAALDECAALIKPLREAWLAIQPKPGQPA